MTCRTHLPALFAFVPLKLTFAWFAIGRHVHGKIDSQKEYRLKSIVGEDETHDRYLISWEDDPDTGESFVDTWEPRANANQAAIDDWERQKADKASM